MNRISRAASIDGLFICNQYVNYKNHRFLFIDSTLFWSSCDDRPGIDALIISKNPKIYLPRLSNAFNIKQVVFDGSVPFWKLSSWKKDCDSLHIPYYDVNEKGAFVMTLN